MKGSKRFLALLLSVIMIFSFVGCDVEKNDYDNSSSIVSSTNSSESLNTSSDNETYIVLLLSTKTDILFSIERLKTMEFLIWLKAKRKE